LTRRRQMVGKAGEEAARSYLQRRGYRVVEANYRSRFGEIDLIAFQGSTLVFVEVRCRTGSSFGLPEESVTPEKMRRLQKAALSYMQLRFGREVACRFDLIAVLLDGESMAVQDLRHYRGIELVG